LVGCGLFVALAVLISVTPGGPDWPAWYAAPFALAAVQADASNIRSMGV
jgi:hypothetical protein